MRVSEHVQAKPYGALGLLSPSPSITNSACEPYWPAPAALLMLLPFAPPLWFRAMDPLADAANTQHALAVGVSNE